MPDEYSELEVRIHSMGATAGRYRVEAELNDAPIGEGELVLDEQQLLRAELDSIAYGQLLFNALFSGEMRDAYNQARGQADVQTEGRLRVRLRIEEAAAELHALPWERLYHIYKGQLVPLAVSASTPFSRYLPVPGVVSSATSERPVRLLVVLSNPNGLPEGLSPIDVRAEIENLQRALGDLRRTDQVRVTVLPGHTLLPPEWVVQLEAEGYTVIQDHVERVASLDNIVQRLPEHHILHFIGHGHFRRQSERGPGHAALYLERADGGWEAVRDGELTARLGSIRPAPCLVVLQACESAARDPEGPFIGLGPKLVRAGIPAVVAMRERVEMEVAQQFTNGFYRRLLEHGAVDRALNEARNLLFDQEDVDWAIPVLFMHRGAGQLFAANRVRMVMQAIHRWAEDKLVDTPQPMPTEVVHLVGSHDIGSLERSGRGVVPAVNMLESVPKILSQDVDPARHKRGRWIVLVGGRGTARSSQLRHLVRQVAGGQLATASGTQGTPILPLYVDLGDYPTVRAGPRNPIEVLILEHLEHFWPDLKASRLSDLFQLEGRLTLWVLLDGSDDLSDRQRRDSWREIGALVDDHPEHAYLLTVDTDHFVSRQLSGATDLLVIQPLSPRAIEAFLSSSGQPEDMRLYRALRSTRLFDLAGTPWLLARMLQQARNGVYPRSRTEVLEGLVEDAIANITAGHVLRSRAAPTLYTLAYETKSQRHHNWDIGDAFRVMASVRGNREYSLEALYDELVEIGLLARVGQDVLRFAYPAYEDYCCAKAIDGFPPPKRDRVLEDIAASLGRLTRLRAWEGTLVLLSGLMSNPNVLLRNLLYGASLGDGEQIYVAVRCLQESGEQRVDASLRERVVDALVWRLDPANVSRPARRARAAQALGELQPSSALPYLARLANQRVRPGSTGAWAYDYSSVRMAAAMALRRFVPRHEPDIRAIDTELADLLALWVNRDAAALGTWVRSGRTGSQPLAAFALGELYTQGMHECLDTLIDVFYDSDIPGATRWAVADALTLLDATLVTRRAILPLIDRSIAREDGLLLSVVWRRRALQYERLAYLIGLVRSSDPTAREFLRERLRKDRRVAVKGKAIQSLGWLYDSSSRDVLERMANGEFRDLTLSTRISLKDKVYLRQKAIEALAYIGDQRTLDRLRASRADWTPELQQAFYETSEEIVWRQEAGRQG